MKKIMRLRWLVLIAVFLVSISANTVKVQLLAPENHSKQKIPFVLVLSCQGMLTFMLQMT
jgi:hypothetical protein